MKKIYAEIGLGNDTFLSTEIEQDGQEYRIPRFALPQKIQEVYFRFWFRKKVFVFSIPKGISIRTKDRKGFKVLFGVGGTCLEEIREQ